MKAVPRLLYLLFFIGLATVAALTLNRVLQPSAATVLIRALFIASACGAPGLVFRKMWPLSILLIPVGCYLLLRTTVPLPATVEGIGEQYRFYMEQLQLGASAYKHALFPLNLTEAPQLRLLMAFVVYWLTGAGAFLALSLRRAIPGVVCLLALLGFGMTVDASVRVVWPALLFIILAGSLLVLSRTLDRAGWRFRDALVGTAVGVIASLLALGLLAAAPSVVASPWQDWRHWDFFDRGGSAYTFNWLQNYPKLLNPANDVPIMRVESPSPSYWRASSLDSFTGTAWVTSRAFLVRIEGQRQEGGDGDQAFLYRIPPVEPTPEGETVTESFQIQSVYTNYFFIGGDPRSIALDRELPLRMNDMRALHVGTALGPSLSYSATAVIPELDPAALVDLGNDYSEDLDAFLTLPFSRVADISGPDKATTWRDTVGENSPDGWEWVDLYDLNQRIIGDATDPYEIALRIERYLRQSFTYSLAPPVSEFSSPYAAFLFDTRTGYCQHFAGAMALLLRYNGIPARVAVGFVTGEENEPGVYLVSTNNAHAWVEMYFPTVGWVAFDPTPGRSLPVAGASSTSPGFINPFVDSNPSGPGTVDTEPPPGNLPNGEEIGGETAEDEGPGLLSRAAWLPWVAALALIVIGWPVVRALWQRRGLHRGSLEQRLQASLGLLRGHLSDYDVLIVPSDTLEEVIQTLRGHLSLAPDSVFLDRTEAVLFGGRNARVNDLRRAEKLRREARVLLRKRHGWMRTTLAWYGVPRLSSRRGREARGDAVRSARATDLERLLQ